MAFGQVTCSLKTSPLPPTNKVHEPFHPKIKSLTMRSIKHKIICLLLCLPLLVQTQKPEAAKELDAFQKDCLDAHNTYRSQHGAPPLVWSAELAQHAQNWADELASRDEVKHDLVAISKDDEGENLAFFHPAVPKCQGTMEGNCVLCREMVKRWYDEGKNYDYDSGHSKNPERVTKHFTQILWANTSELGIGTSVSKRYGFITVARYRPRGNRGGADAFIVNVPPEGGPLPSLSNDPPNKAPKSAPSTTPTGNGIPVTNPDSSNPPQASQTVRAPSGTDDVDVSSKLSGSLDGSAIEKIQANPFGNVMNDEVQNKLPKKAANILSMIVDLASKTKPENNNNNQVPDEGSQNQNKPKDMKSSLAGIPGQNSQEESSLEAIHDNFSYENSKNMFSNDNHDGANYNEGSHDSSVTASILGSPVDGNHGNAKGIAKTRESHDSKQDQGEGSQGPEHPDVEDNMEENGSEAGRAQGRNTLSNRLNIHTDDGLLPGENDLPMDLKDRGLVRTVKGPDGTNAQVFLTKNGAHAGLVFRDYISRVSSELKQQQRRIIHVL